jgi:hypothetical protein
MHSFPVSPATLSGSELDIHTLFRKKMEHEVADKVLPETVKGADFSPSLRHPTLILVGDPPT